MSLNTYINDKIQGFRKQGCQSLLFGLQIVPSNVLPYIYNAYPGLSNANPISIELVKISSKLKYNSGTYIWDYTEIERTSLPLNSIQYDATTGQYLTQDIDLTALLEECIYFIEFTNGSDIYRTEAFKVSDDLNDPKGIDYDAVGLTTIVY